MPTNTGPRTLAEFIEEAETEFTGFASRWFYPVAPARVATVFPSWEASPVDTAIIFLAALNLEGPDQALYAWAISGSLAVPGIYLLRRSFGFPSVSWVVFPSADHPWAREKRNADFLEFTESFKRAVLFLAREEEGKTE